MEPVTVMVARRVTDGREAEFEVWASALTATAAGFAGFLRAGLLRPGRAGQPWHIVYRFDSTDTLDAWERSPARAGVLGTGAHLVAETTVARVSGLETWFALPGRAGAAPPARWKMFVVSGACIFLLQLVIYAVFGPIVSHWPLAVRLAVVVTVVSGLMTWAVMPTVARLLAPWFYPGPR